MVACEPTSQLLRRLDSRTVVVTPEAPAAAPDLAPFDARLRPGGDLAVTFKTGEAGVEQVLAAVRAAGVQIKDLRTEDPDLEDVFVSLTYAAPDTAVGRRLRAICAAAPFSAKPPAPPATHP